MLFAVFIILLFSFSEILMYCSQIFDGLLIVTKIKTVLKQTFLL